MMAAGTTHGAKFSRATNPWSSSGFISAGNRGSVAAATIMPARASQNPRA